MFIPRIAYTDDVGAPVVLLLTLPMLLWEPEEQGVGGWDETGSGAPIVWEQRHDYEAIITPRFTEAEYPSVSAWLRQAINRGKVSEIRFDASNPATAFNLWVVRPRMGERWKPRRNPDYPRAYETSLTVRSSTGTRIHLLSA